MSDYSLVILISGNGSNLQAIIDAIQGGQLKATINAVVSDQAKAYGLARAAHANIPSHIIQAADYSDRQSYDNALQICLEKYQPDLIVLAGFMRILSAGFVNHFLGRLINIHPALLPKFPGLQTHQRVLEADEIEHGVSIHFVTPTVDAGPIIAQTRFKIRPGDTVNSLTQQIHRLEHQLYPRVINWFSQGKVRLEDDGIYLNRELLPISGVQLEYEG